VFWFYVEEADKLRARAKTGGRIEISGSNNPAHAMVWDSRKYIADVCTDGWNYISLPFSEGRNMDEAHPFNHKAANYFRIYFDGTVDLYEMTFGIDAIGFKQDK
jgi:hypothetical protein